MPNTLRNHSHHIDKKLRRRLRIYFIISLILIVLLIYDVFNGTLLPSYGIFGIIGGIILGIIASRMFHTSWDKNAKQIISRLDTFGIIILIGYIIFAIFRSKLISYFTNGVDVSTVGFAVLTGIMLGRLIGTRGRIIQILKEEKVFR